MSEEKFIRYILQEISDLLNDGHKFMAFVLMSQAIEVLGSFLDNKPFKATSQSKKRFRTALYYLFPPEYSRANKGDKLYMQFRSSLAHVFIPSPKLKLIKDNPENHLIANNDVLHINAESLLNDLENAGEKIIKRLKSGEIKRKNIYIDWMNDN